MLKHQTQQDGFTLVELMFSMALFSFGLLIIVAGFLALLGFYQNGTQSRVVQTAARAGINSISQTGRSAQQFYYNNTLGPGADVLCIAGGSSGNWVYYVKHTATNDQLMQAGWNPALGCVGPGIKPSAVTTLDAHVTALLVDPADNYLDLSSGNNIAIAPCTGGSTCGLSQLAKSVRVTLRVASSPNFLDPASDTGTGRTSCSPSAPAYCVVTALSTTLTAGELGP